MKANEIIFTTRYITNEIEIGLSGGPLYRVDRLKIQVAIWDGKLKDTPEDVLRYAIKESQYVDFEEVKTAKMPNSTEFITLV